MQSQDFFSLSFKEYQDEQLQNLRKFLKEDLHASQEDQSKKVFWQNKKDKNFPLRLDDIKNLQNKSIQVDSQLIVCFLSYLQETDIKKGDFSFGIQFHYLEIIQKEESSVEKSSATLGDDTLIEQKIKIDQVINHDNKLEIPRFDSEQHLFIVYFVKYGDYQSIVCIVKPSSDQIWLNVYGNLKQDEVDSKIMSLLGTQLKLNYKIDYEEMLIQMNIFISKQNNYILQGLYFLEKWVEGCQIEKIKINLETRTKLELYFEWFFLKQKYSQQSILDQKIQLLKQKIVNKMQNSNTNTNNNKVDQALQTERSRFSSPSQLQYQKEIMVNQNDSSSHTTTNEKNQKSQNDNIKENNNLQLKNIQNKLDKLNLKKQIFLLETNFHTQFNLNSTSPLISKSQKEINFQQEKKKKQKDKKQFRSRNHSLSYGGEINIKDQIKEKKKHEVKKRIILKLRSKTGNISPEYIDKSVLSYRINQEIIPIQELNSERSQQQIQKSLDNKINVTDVDIGNYLTGDNSILDSSIIKSTKEDLNNSQNYIKLPKIEERYKKIKKSKLQKRNDFIFGVYNQTQEIPLKIQIPVNQEKPFLQKLQQNILNLSPRQFKQHKIQIEPVFDSKSYFNDSTIKQKFQKSQQKQNIKFQKLKTDIYQLISPKQRSYSTQPDLKSQN